MQITTMTLRRRRPRRLGNDIEGDSSAGRRGNDENERDDEDEKEEEGSAAHPSAAEKAPSSSKVDECDDSDDRGGEDAGRDLHYEGDNGKSSSEATKVIKTVATTARSAADDDAEAPGRTQEKEVVVGTRTRRSSSFHIAKWLILRSVGAMYFVAFLGAYYQNEGLMGSPYGIQPFNDDNNLDRIMQAYNGRPLTGGFANYPMLFWWIPLNDETMKYVIMSGLVLSSLVAFIGINSWFVMLLLWLLDFSIVTVASISANNSWYSYGWESQLLETGFLAIFLCELPSINLFATGRRGSGRAT